ncbi:TetR/AcrR family transcriptional regulator [Phreatobacter stygius]|nr:TetR/AcrR family transcriptional regulator [Phreatobacter stygius]
MQDGTKKPRRTPGRPRSFSEAEVLERVRRVFLEKGFSAASVDDLAKAAGLNRPSLYAAFGNKEQLYLAVIARHGTQSVAGIDQIMAGEGSIEQRLTKLYRTAISLYTAPPRPQGCMIIGTASVEAPTHPDIAKAAAAFIAGNEKALERAFANAVEAGELSPEPSPVARARLGGAIFDTLAVRARIGTSIDDLRAFASSAVPLICASPAQPT